jgi:hypothetical protein
VPQVGPPGSGSQFTTIQDAVDAAKDGDTVLVDAGVYSGKGNRDITFKGKSRLTLRSLLGRDTCIIDLERRSGHRAFLFKYDETPDAVRIVGFTIRNGRDEDGAAIKCVGSTSALKGSPTIEDCVLLDCSAQNRGGAIYCNNKSVPTIRNCTFVGNRSGGDGGALAVEGSAKVIAGSVFDTFPDAVPRPRIERCRFERNEADRDGGALWVSNHAQPDLAECQVERNVAGRHGGGMAYDDHAFGNVVESSIVGNTANRDGGGVWLNDGSVPRFSRCSLRDNAANRNGGGASINNPVVGTRELNHPDEFTGLAIFAYCLIAMNRADGGTGGGVQCDAVRATPQKGMVVSHCAITGNTAGGGGGLAIRRARMFVNNAVVNRNQAIGQPGNGGGILVQEGTLSARFSTLYGNTAAGHGDGIDMDLAVVSLESTIVWPASDGAARGPLFRPAGSSVGENRRGSLRADYCNVFGSHSMLFDDGANNIGTSVTPVAGKRPDDPLLLPAGAFDPFPQTEYVLRSDASGVSPCKDRGRPQNVYVNQSSTGPFLPWPDDIAGRPRKSGTVPDIGAYEVQPSFVGSAASAASR